MKIEQIYEALNAANKAVLGETAVLAEDLSNIVDIGNAVFDNNSFDPYSHALIDKVGRMVFVNRPYRGSAPSILMDAARWGSVMQKVSSEMPESSANEAYDLQNGASYDGQIFYQPVVYEKFYAKYVTFEVDRSITEKQLKSAFNSVGEMDGFLSMLYNEIEKRFTVDLENLIFRTLDSAIADTLYADYNSGSSFSDASHTRAVNLLYLYNTTMDPDTHLTVENCRFDLDFLKFASYMMGVYSDRLVRISTLFNVGGAERFTPKDEQHFILLSDFAKAADSYLQSDTFHEQYTALANHETVAYWQAPGTSYAFSDVSAINVTSGSGHTVNASGILGVLFDSDALGVHGIERWVNTQYVPKGDFTNYFYRYKAGFFTDTGNENFIVFFVA